MPKKQRIGFAKTAQQSRGRSASKKTQKKPSRTPVLPAKSFPGSEASLASSLYNADDDESEVFERVHDLQFHRRNMKGLNRNRRKGCVAKPNAGWDQKDGDDVEAASLKLRDEDDKLIFGPAISRPTKRLKVEENGDSFKKSFNHVEKKHVTLKQETIAGAWKWGQMHRDTKREDVVKVEVGEIPVYAADEKDEEAEFEELVQDQIRREIHEQELHAGCNASLQQSSGSSP